MTNLTTTEPSPLAALLANPEAVASLDVEKMRALLEMRREEEQAASVRARVSRPRCRA